MVDNPLHGIKYHQFKDGHLYEVTFPPRIIEDPLRHSNLYQFDVQTGKQDPSILHNILISWTLDACTDTTTKNLLAMRHLYELLGAPSCQSVIATNDQERLLNDKEEDRNLIRYEILKYATDRYEELFDVHFLALEFAAAITANSGEIIRQLVYFHKHGMIEFHSAYERAIARQDYLSMLTFRLEFNQSMKAEALELVRQYEEGLAEGEPVQQGSAVSDNTEPSKSVFIVHGRDVLSAQAVAGFIEKCGLQAIMLLDQPEEGQTIIEKLEKHGDPGFAVVILAPEDEGRLRNTEEALKGRARQNVVFELGFFFGKIGRKRILCLLDTADAFEKPSDIHGILYKPFDHAGTWKQSVAKELKAAGYDIDLNKALT